MTEPFIQQTAFKVEECTDGQIPQMWISLRFQGTSDIRKARLAQYKARLRRPQTNDCAILFSVLVLVFFLLLELTNPVATQVSQQDSPPTRNVVLALQRNL